MVKSDYSAFGLLLFMLPEVPVSPSNVPPVPSLLLNYILSLISFPVPTATSEKDLVGPETQRIYLILSLKLKQQENPGTVSSQDVPTRVGLREAFVPRHDKTTGLGPGGLWRQKLHESWGDFLPNLISCCPIITLNCSHVTNCKCCHFPPVSEQ